MSSKEVLVASDPHPREPRKNANKELKDSIDEAHRKTVEAVGAAAEAARAWSAASVVAGRVGDPTRAVALAAFSGEAAKAAANLSGLTREPQLAQTKSYMLDLVFGPA